MDILRCFRTSDDILVVTLPPELSGTVVSELRRELPRRLASNPNVVINAADVQFFSSAGLRLLLSIYREVAATEGRIVLAAVPSDLHDTIQMTGFLPFFEVAESVEAAMAQLRRRRNGLNTDPL